VQGIARIETDVRVSDDKWIRSELLISQRVVYNQHRVPPDGLCAQRDLAWGLLPERADNRLEELGVLRDQ
jgi:hypothetical protein